MQATTSHSSTPLVETCLPVKSSFSKRLQRLSDVVETHLVLVLDAHRPCQRPFDGRLRPGGVPLCEGVGRRTIASHSRRLSFLGSDPPHAQACC